MFRYFVALGSASRRNDNASAMDTEADVVTSTTTSAAGGVLEKAGISQLADYDQFDDQVCEDLTLREVAEEEYDDEMDQDVDTGGGDGGYLQPAKPIRGYGEARDVLGPMPGTASGINKPDAVRRNGASFAGGVGMCIFPLLPILFGFFCVYSVT